MGKGCFQANIFIFRSIFVELAGNQYRYKILNSGQVESVHLELRALERQKNKLIYLFKHEYLFRPGGQSCSNFMCVASMGWGKGCIRFRSRLDQNCGGYGNQKLPSTYNGENGVHLFSVIFDRILAKLTGIQDRCKISDFKFQPDWNIHFSVLAVEHWKKFSWTIMGK